MNLGHTIANLRDKRMLKQAQLADQLEITTTYLSQIENNHKTPNIALLEKIGKVLSMPLPFLFVLSLDENDIPKEKEAQFRLIAPALKNFVQELIESK